MELAIILGVSAIALVLLVMIYNGIVRRQHAVDQAWADVIATQRQYEQVVPGLESILGNYTGYESETLKQVVKLREALNELKRDSTVGLTGQVMQQAQDLMQSLRLTVEAYPNLKADRLAQNLMNETARIQDNVAAAVRIFNMNVAEHNAGLEAFPNNLMNSAFNRLKPFEPFQDQLASSRFDYSPYNKQ